jgi:glycine/D-amino acid oxidase-like deaminating enzyme
VNEVSGSRVGTLWEATAQTTTAWPRLDANVDAEVAIIGAGIAGLSLALHLAELGHKPVVIEAEAEGGGAAGRSAGLVAPQLVRQTPASVARAIGKDRAKKLLNLVADGANHVFDIVGDRMDLCGAMQNGFLAPARGVAGSEKVAELASGWRAIREDLQVFDGPEIEKVSGCTGYSSGIFDPTGGAINPLAYTRLLACDAAKAGAKIYTKSRIESVESVGDRWRLSCSGVTITAKSVIACANGGNVTLHRSLKKTMLGLPVCQVATTPLSIAEQKSILSTGIALTDMETDVFSLRYDPEGRLITAYPLGEDGHNNPNIEQLVNRRLAAAIPAYKPRSLDHAWTGVAWLNPSFLPKIFALGKGFYAVQACNGRGIALNTVIGRDFARWISGGCSGDWALNPESPHPISGYYFAKYAPLLMMKAALFKQSFNSQFQRA